MSWLVLSLFPGIGLLDRAFEEEGFCVVRGPDILWGGDIRRFHPPAGRFDGVIGGPPCQAFSRLRHLVEANGYRVAADLIPEFDRVLAECKASWWVMENVMAAPILCTTRGWMSLRDSDCGGSTARTRRISWGGIDLELCFQAPSGAPPRFPAVTGPGRVKLGGSGRVKRTIDRISPTFREACERQGLPKEFDLPGMTAAAKMKAVGNGVPLAMGRAIAQAVKRALVLKGDTP